MLWERNMKCETKSIIVRGTSIISATVAIIGVALIFTMGGQYSEIGKMMMVVGSVGVMSMFAYTIKILFEQMIDSHKNLLEKKV